MLLVFIVVIVMCYMQVWLRSHRMAGFKRGWLEHVVTCGSSYQSNCMNMFCVAAVAGVVFVAAVAGGVQEQLDNRKTRHGMHRVVTYSVFYIATQHCTMHGIV